MRRRGQAALEYLVTYGWGILAIMVVFGALSDFGMFDPARYLPDRCEFGAQLQCVDYQFAAAGDDIDKTNGYVRLQFRDNFGDAVNVTGVWVAAGSAASLAYGEDLGSLGAWPAAGVRIAQGNISGIIQAALPKDYPLLIVAGDRQPITLIVEFRRDAAGAPSHNVSGEVFATAIQ